VCDPTQRNHLAEGKRGRHGGATSRDGRLGSGQKGAAGTGAGSDPSENVADPEDLYGLLGVSRTASDDEIRRAYRKLARQHHPDVNPGDKGAEEQFKKISAAYDVLSDAEKRKAYDEFGAESLKSGFDPEKSRAYRRWSEGRSAAGQAGRGQPQEEVPFDFDLDELLGGFAQRRARRPQEVVAEVELDFADALRGTELEARVPVPRSCPTCHGSGDKPGSEVKTCSACGGTGRVQAVEGPMRFMTPCRACGGDGKIGTPCPTCAGSGAVAGEERLRVRIPPGADDGSELRVRGKVPGPPGTPPGDLVIRTRVRPHPHFRRQDLDLYLDLPVTLDEAYSGATVEAPTPDGPVKLKIPPRSQPGTRLRLKGKGVARGQARGDLFVDVDPRLPDESDDALAEALRGARNLYRRPVREGIEL
jgi:molecular chaperone DnaJ